MRIRQGHDSPTPYNNNSRQTLDVCRSSLRKRARSEADSIKCEAVLNDATEAQGPANSELISSDEENDFQAILLNPNCRSRIAVAANEINQKCQATEEENGEYFPDFDAFVNFVSDMETLNPMSNLGQAIDGALV